MKVNIVMLVKNRLQLTMQALNSLYAHTPHEDFNLVIINDESDHMTAVCIHSKLRPAKNWTMLHDERSSGITGQARNLGVYWAEKYWGRGEYLYLSDNDVYFTPGWLATLTGYFNGLEMVSGYRVLGGWNHPFLQPTFHNENRDYASHDAVAGASQLVRWDTWDKYGPLDAHASGVGQSEDWKFCQDIIKDGGRVGSIYPRVVLNCGLTNSLGQPSPGADVMLKELQEAKKLYPTLVWE